MIGIGTIAYLSCENKYVGALLFCVGLFTICSFGLTLFTGMCGYVYKENSLSDLVFVWIGNLIGVAIVALIMTPIMSEFHVQLGEIVILKIQTNAYKTSSLSIMCGVLMFVAVDVFKTQNDVSKYLGIFLCVPTFILCGFEHSIANMFYMASGISTGILKSHDILEALFFILVCTMGNMTGAVWSKVASNYIKKP